jgi:histidyl-tRNA synthetase
MMKDFGGPDICGTGFAMGMERLLSLVSLPPHPGSFIYLAWMGDLAKGEAMQAARFFRKEGVECLVEYKKRSLKNQMSRASKLGATWVLIIGDEEVSKQEYQLKNMKTGLQKEAAREEILACIKKG